MSEGAYYIGRDDAESLVDLLLLVDHPCARELGAYIRDKFGMVGEDEQKKAEKWSPEVLARLGDPVKIELLAIGIRNKEYREAQREKNKAISKALDGLAEK
jgi:hypothetical protein